MSVVRSWISVLVPDDGDPRHGTNGYANLGCRCQVCRDANAAWQKKRRKEREALLAADYAVAEHGRASTYENYRCRCRQCKDAHALSGRKTP